MSPSLQIGVLVTGNGEKNQWPSKNVLGWKEEKGWVPLPRQCQEQKGENTNLNLKAALWAHLSVLYLLSCLVLLFGKKKNIGLGRQGAVFLPT